MDVIYINSPRKFIIRLNVNFQQFLEFEKYFTAMAIIVSTPTLFNNAFYQRINSFFDCIIGIVIL